jgi:hypothetical protein
MPWKELAALAALLLVIVIFGNFWFYLVESVLERIRRLFTRHREPPAWHPLPKEEEDVKQEEKT